MKVFGTHLPPMPRGEQIILLGQIQRALDLQTGGVWQVTSDTARAVILPHLLIQARSKILSLSLYCEILGAPSDDAELRVSFDEMPNPSRESENLVGATMRSIHGVLQLLLGPSPQQKMWLMTTGQWIFGTQFDS
jgi:hypothetical protein